ncbi:RNA recognition motif domain-containing protein [Saprospira grandis]|uniref:RNA recognition motif domain-containing protein n=1 Tax=Saprospira grandis TaxID=1008 RepID=UPI0022DD62CE|nr:RNA-binding protein [Saprospira grandis]WBM75212.1 RNA-binding protein [Saprospira grandis]
MNIFVAKLNFRTTSEELEELFAQFGTVDSAKIIMDRETDRSKGFGFVEMPDEEDGQAAIDALNETEFHERTIVVKKARPREERPRNNNRGGGRGGYDRGGRSGGGYDRGGRSGGGYDRGGRGGYDY